MIQIVMKPDYDAGVVDKKTLYKVLFNGEDVGLRVRGFRAAHAEAMLMEIFRLDLKGKEVDYDLEAYRKNKEKAGGCQEDAAEAEEAESEAEELGKQPDLPGME